MGRLKKGTPGKGGQARVESFSYTPVQVGLGKAWFGTLAGEVYWCLAHEHTEQDHGTKPCLNWLTDGALRCRRCSRVKPPAWIGYVPIYRELDGRPVVVIVHECAADLLDGLRYPQTVFVGRVDATAGVFVRAAKDQVTFKTEIESRKRPIDVTPQLLAMWKLPDLETWLSSRGRVATAEPLPEKQTDGPPPRRTTAPDDGAYLLGDSFMGALPKETQEKIRARRAAAQTSENGKHKPPG